MLLYVLVLQLFYALYTHAVVVVMGGGEGVAVWSLLAPVLPGSPLVDDRFPYLSYC